MNITVSNINHPEYSLFRGGSKKIVKPQVSVVKDVLPVYGDEAIRTKPAQLSLFHMHDFHGQNIRMERAYSAVRQFDDDNLYENKVFDSDMPVDKLKLCSGDMFLGENLKEVAVVNEFLNMSGVLADAIGNHECDAESDVFVDIVKNRKYKFLSTNMHPQNGNKMNEIISSSFIVESHGNKYGIIGLSPLDMNVHLKRAEDIPAMNISEFDDTIKDIQSDISLMKGAGVNKIILLSHLGLEHEQYIAQNVSDVDVILGGHTHHLLKDVKEGENLFYSPKGEPVLIMQTGRDGEYIGIPNIKFNELGQITGIQYNVLKTDDFSRSSIAKSRFEKILGKPEVVGEIGYAEAMPEDIYANENPHGSFIADCIKSELDTDIAVVNSSNLRGQFFKGSIDARDLHLITPFGNKMVVIEATEKEVVDSVKGCLEVTMANPKHRPGILQVSGLRYSFSSDTGELKSMDFVDKNNNVHKIDINNPRTDKIYTVACDDFCAIKANNGMGLPHRYDTALAIYDFDKDELVARHIKKQTSPVEIKSDGRIKKD